MVALSSDYFQHVGSPGTATTLAAPGHVIGGTTITVVSTSNWPTDSGVTFAMDATTLVGGVETRTVGTYTEWSGVVTSATTIESMVLRLGTDQNYSAGSSTRVYIPVASSEINRLVDGLLVSHNQDGTLKAGGAGTGVANDNLDTTAGDIGGASLTNWVPTYTCSGSMTFTSVTTTSSYFKIGKFIFFKLRAGGTTGGTTSHTIAFSLPVNTIGTTAYNYSAYIEDTAAAIGFAYGGSTSTIGVRNATGANWGIGGGRSINVSGFYEVA